MKEYLKKADQIENAIESNGETLSNMEELIVQQNVLIAKLGEQLGKMPTALQLTNNAKAIKRIEDLLYQQTELAVKQAEKPKKPATQKRKAKNGPDK